MMGDLARRRSARDLRISRSHLWAGGAALCLAAGVAFLLGYSYGREGSQAPRRGAYVEPAGEEALGEVLARVEASVRTDGGVRALTFPDELTRPVEGDPPPPGAFDVEVGRFDSVVAARPLVDFLREAELPAWLAVERHDGVAVYRVAVGGWPTEAAAEAQLEPVSEALALYAGAKQEPQVIPRSPSP